MKSQSLAKRAAVIFSYFVKDLSCVQVCRDFELVVYVKKVFQKGGGGGVKIEDERRGSRSNTR